MGGMASRRAPRSAPAASRTAPAACPCGSPAPYPEHCGKLHAGEVAARAEDLMRARYSAFVVGDEAYLRRSWHPDTCPPVIGLDGGTRWEGLEIEAGERGSAFHQDGTVTFRARYREGGTPGALHERSRFTRVGGEWVYVDGDFLD
ncbi:YchJ family protein [Streptomyces sp. NPDC088925]|uniref:YchJ family protein n=1 Tax=Streptomyces sp. NPDC088925 TaxID=3365914 RepID=UPI00382A35AE